MSNDIGTEEDVQPKDIKGSCFELGIQQSTGDAAVKWLRNAGRLAHPQEVIDFTAATLLWNLGGDGDKIISGFTEYRVKIQNTQQLFRDHPTYRSDSRQRRDVWYDWAVFDLSNIPGFGNKPRPAQLLMFIDIPELEEAIVMNGIEVVGGNFYSVVRMFGDEPDCDFRTPYVSEDDSTGDNLYSYLLEFGTLFEHFHLLPCEKIVDTAIVVPNIEVRPYKEGPKNVREERKRTEMEDVIAPLGPGFFVVAPRRYWGMYLSNLIDSF